ncbi:MAG: AbrB/MazE/SpoVT family DNA-binding domain-containing protein [Nanoarchaeota archaeon]
MNKYVIVIPNELIESADFKEGDELEGESTKGEIRLKKR